MSEQAQAAPAPADTAAAASAAAATPADTGTPAPAPAPAGGEGTPAPAPAPAPQDTSSEPGTDLGQNGSGQGSDDNEWTTVLDDDTRQLVEQKGYKSPNDLGKAYRELSKKLGERVPEPPADDADTEAWDAYYKSIGRPDTPEKYEFKIPEGVPENIPYDSDFATKFKNWAHKSGLTPKQAQSLHDQYVNDFAGQMGTVQEQVTEKVQTAHAAIQKEWGDAESEGYRQNVELARRAMVQLDLKDDLTGSGLLDADGNVTSAKVAFALARVGSKMFGEDKMFGGPSAGIKNPFSDQSENMTQQSMLIKNDPGRAKQLILAAGKNPEDYGM